MRTYLKIKSYRRMPVSRDFKILNWQFAILCFYIIKQQSHWIPGQARNDKKHRKTNFEIGSNTSFYLHYILHTASLYSSLSERYNGFVDQLNLMASIRRIKVKTMVAIAAASARIPEYTARKI